MIKVPPLHGRAHRMRARLMLSAYERDVAAVRRDWYLHARRTMGPIEALARVYGPRPLHLCGKPDALPRAVLASLARIAGYDDVAGKPPPPIALTHPYPCTDVRVNFEAPIDASLSEIARHALAAIREHLCPESS